MVRVFLRTYGCSLNRSDSEVMLGVLVANGHEIVSEESADVIIINSCTVKSSPEQRLFHELRHTKKPVVVAGCVPQADPENEHFYGVSVIGPKALSRVAYAVEETFKGGVVTLLGDVDDDRLGLPIVQRTTRIGIIPINAGCLGACSYCKTKHARGHLISYPAQAIEQRFLSLVDGGAKELWLTSQDTGVYGLDAQTDIVSLVERLLQKPGDYRVRLGMANPQFLLPHVDRLVTLLRHERMFRFLHIPVQSGSAKVLGDMRRGYTVEQFTTLVNGLLRAVPDLTIATDVIVGFPTETEDDFQLTLRLIKDLRIPVVNVSKFYPRPGTPAAALPLLPTRTVKERSTRLKQVCEEVARVRNASFVGVELSVIIDEQGGKPGTLIGRADNYLQVILPEALGVIGERVMVVPSAAGTFDVRAL